MFPNKEIYLKRYSALFVLVFLFNCGTSGSTVISQSQKARLDNLFEEKNFVITCDRALPMMTNSMNSLSNSGLFPPGSTANQINLTGNGNYLKVIGDSVAAQLPYFGERQMGGGYNLSGAGIQFEGVPKVWKLNKKGNKGSYELRFKINQASESFNVNVVVFPNLSSTININSSQRFPIRYAGSAAPISE